MLDAIRDRIGNAVSKGTGKTAEYTYGGADGARAVVDGETAADQDIGRSETLRGAEFESGHRNIQPSDARSTSQTEHDQAIPESATTRSGHVSDLSHMPQLGDLVDAGKHTPDDLALNRALQGFKRQYGPYRLDDIDAYYDEYYDGKKLIPGTIKMEARIIDSNGAEAGFIIRNFRRESDGELVVEEIMNYLYEGFRGQGFGTAFSKASEDYYRRSGVDRTEIEARPFGEGEEDGGIIAARRGFGWDPRYLYDSVAGIEGRIDSVIFENPGISGSDRALLESMKERFSGDVGGYPSPQELVEMAGDDPKLGEKVMRGSHWFGVKKP